jgi:hypothetical protein
MSTYALSSLGKKYLPFFRVIPAKAGIQRNVEIDKTRWNLTFLNSRMTLSGEWLQV